jgi:two-component system, NarL family, sensor kinase
MIRAIANFYRFLVRQFSSKNKSIILGLLGMGIVLDFSTPVSYVFGYLYIIPIVYASNYLSNTWLFNITKAAILLTLLNLFVPNFEIAFPTSINRSIVVMALVITAKLCIMNHKYQEATARQQAQLQSQEMANRLREDFMSTLTHDLKTPLLGAIETLKSFREEKFGKITPTQQKVLETMRSSHQNSLQLLETLLDVYRNDAEGPNLDRKPVDLTLLAEAAIAQLTELAQNRRVHLHLNYGNSNFRRPAWVWGDELQLHRVLTNLLANAINHSPRGGRVEIRLESSSTHQVVQVSDDGSGIAVEEYPYLFERFYQGSSNRQAKGTGLGLYLSRQIIVAHQGTIWAERDRAIGATFAFKLPACHPDSATPP